MAVAQRMYARALFQAARDEGRLEPVASDLADLAVALDEVPELRSFLRNPEVEPAGKAEVLREIAAGADELVRNFVHLVAEKGRAGELADEPGARGARRARAEPARRRAHDRPRALGRGREG